MDGDDDPDVDFVLEYSMKSPPMVIQDDDERNLEPKAYPGLVPKFIDNVG